MEGNELPPAIVECGCVVAGTMVHTRSGLIPVEQIKVGDWVLSRPAMEGEHAYKQVAQTLIFDDREVWSVDFATPDTIDTVVSTGNHRFRVKGIGWTRADYLRYPHVLERSDGSTCKVFNVSPIVRTSVENIGWIQGGFGVQDYEDEFGRVLDFRNDSILIDYEIGRQARNEGVSPAKENLIKRRVYNLEVQDYHTYYVGKLGIWVHDVDGADPRIA